MLVSASGMSGHPMVLTKEQKQGSLKLWFQASRDSSHGVFVVLANVFTTRAKFGKFFECPVGSLIWNKIITVGSSFDEMKRLGRLVFIPIPYL